MNIESPIGAVERVLRHHKIEPSNVLCMMLIDAVRETTPPPREMTIAVFQKLLASLSPERALDDWATRMASEIVTIIADMPPAKNVAKAIAAADESGSAVEYMWDNIEGTITGMLLRVVRGLDLQPK